ncbi:MAG: DUF547 domain-containing protein, partial [Bacteroidota bacterium]
MPANTEENQMETRNVSLESDPEKQEKLAEVVEVHGIEEASKTEQKEIAASAIKVNEQKSKELVEEKLSNLAIDKAEEKAPISTPTEKKEEIITKLRKTETSGVPKESSLEDTEPEKPSISHDAWDQLLKKYVSSSGKVNYKGFKTEKAKLEAYVKYLGENTPQADWSRNKIRAYWINAYNAFTVKLILDNYPLKSIMNLDSGKPWDKAFISLGGKSYTLNDIEHKILRAKYFDSRIHFAVNCASFSCPKLLNRAFTESNVSSQMSILASAYINDSRHNKISPEKAELSQLFEWYKGDFTKKG